MLRIALLVFACLLVVFGACLWVNGGALGGGVQVFTAGVILLLGTLFERWRYKNRNASVEGDWQRTGERFVDPQTGKEVEVLYDPKSGERRYQEVV
jgi:hypothetical protein